MNQDVRDVLLGGASLITILAIIVFGVTGWSWHTEHVACLRLSEQTAYPTRMAGTMFGGGCFVKVDGRWIPDERYRSVDVDGD